MNLTGHTKAYAVLGHPIGHTLSPAMHNAGFAALGMDAVYLAFDVGPDRLIGVLESMRDMGFGGVNLTVPLKETAFRGIADLDDSARNLGAVNTVEFLPDMRLRGHNTDARGFLLAFEEAFGAGVGGLRIMVMGCGGAGRAVAIACAGAGAGSLVLTDSDAARPPALANQIAGIAPEVAVEVVPADPARWTVAGPRCDAIIQATPVGMKRSDRPLLSADSFREGQMVFDLVYMYPQTGIMREAAAAGARAANGLGMLLHQGARAFTIWTGRPAAVEPMRQALEQAVYGKKSQ
jgi:shikimate dehydrogenase